MMKNTFVLRVALLLSCVSLVGLVPKSELLALIFGSIEQRESVGSVCPSNCEELAEAVYRDSSVTRIEIPFQDSLRRVLEKGIYPCVFKTFDSHSFIGLGCFRDLDQMYMAVRHGKDQPVAIRLDELAAKFNSCSMNEFHTGPISIRAAAGMHSVRATPANLFLYREEAKRPGGSIAVVNESETPMRVVGAVSSCSCASASVESTSWLKHAAKTDVSIAFDARERDESSSRLRTVVVLINVEFDEDGPARRVQIPVSVTECFGEPAMLKQ